MHAELNASLIGRSVLAMADGYNPDKESSFPDTALESMAGVFEQLAAEISAKILSLPTYSASDFARLLLAEAEASREKLDDDAGEDEDGWFDHPSLTVEQRNCTYPQ